MFKAYLFKIRLKRAIKEANEMKKLTNRKYYVMRWQNKLKVFSAMQLRNMRKKGILNIDWLKIQETALYITK